ncbi:MAG TPA: UvrD-helicase domain-containing protein [Thermoanaerobaculia bacterium]|nr:UvrD-helicase domain-containing protein [Thermoanaerobaculia bacterium]
MRQPAQPPETKQAHAPREPVPPGGPADAGDAARLLARDRAARAEAQTRFDSPLVLEAGAGTGKTTTLIARLLAWCLGDGWEKAARGVQDAAGGAQAAGPSASTSMAAAEATAARVLRRVVALTFTEAAAAEMAGRAARELLALGRGGVPAEWMAAARLPPAPEAARRARALLATLDHLTIETIHAWCYRLLAAHPLEAGVHPRLQIDADGRLLQQVITETVEAALQPGYGTPGDPHLLALAAQGCGPREVAEALAALVDGGMTAAALRRDPFAGDGWERLCRRLAAAVAGLHELLAPRLARGRLRNASEILSSLAAIAALRTFATLSGGAPEPARSGAAPEGPPSAHAAPVDRAAELAAIAGVRQLFAAALPPNLRKHLHGWGRGRLGRQEEERLGDVRAELAARAAALARLVDHLDDLDPERLRHGRLALAPLLAAVEDELRRRGIATFDALLRDARRLLAAHPEVRAQLRRGIDQLLVDEFQDTDATQCEVLRWIALDGPAAERPGLFLVGDPKQSIYGWRNADLRAYESFVAKVLEAGGEVRLLVENFRSAPPVLAEVARVIRPVMSERPGVQPPFVPLLPCEGRAADPGFTALGRAPVEHWVSWLPAAAGAKGGGELQAFQAVAAAALEAEAIAADLLELHRRQGMPWRDAAILLRSTGDLETYLDALRRAGIPFAVGRDKQYYRRREVVDAAALVRAVIDPGDHLALVTALRSAAVGVPDAALLPLWRHELPRLLTELHQPSAESLAVVRRAVEAAAAELPSEVPGLAAVAGWEVSLLAAIEQLALLRGAFAAEPADLFVERLRRLLLLDATAAARYLGAYRLANLERFFRRLLVELEQGSGDVAAVLRALRGDLAEGRDAEEGKPPESAEDAVQVLTIHGAKGLDFAHVYLPQLHKPGGGERPATAVGLLPAASGEGGGEYRLLGAATPGFDLAEERRLEVEAAERVRTLYVAMTRAKDRLVLAGDWPRQPRKPAVPDPGRSLEQARSHLQLLAWRAACPDLQRLWLAGGEGCLDQDGVAWRFPALRGGRLAADAEAIGAMGAAGAIAATAAIAGTAAAVVAGAADDAAGTAGGASLAAPAEVASQAALLAFRRAAAAARMARPYGAAASEEAHAQLREAVAAGEAEERGADADTAAAGRSNRRRAAALAAGREAAMASGAALHRALELWDLAAEPAREAERQRALLPAYLSAVAAAEDVARALPRSRRLLERFVAGGLAARLRGLAGRVLARELPVLLAPGPEPPGDAGGTAAAVAFVSGTVDLLYRDPGSGELVIADYKTDDVSGAELERRTAIYASQGAAYVRAVQSALGLAAPPRFELWFVHAGEVVAAP